MPRFSRAMAVTWWTLLSTWPSLSAKASVTPSEEFARVLSRSGAVFDAAVFEEFTVARVLKNPQFLYSFAVRHRSLPLEIRFAVHLLTKDDRERESWRDSYVMASIMNMARKDGGEPAMRGPKAFDLEAVRAEFNADWGATSAFVPDPTFAKYQRGIVTVVYCADTGVLVYAIYLYDGEFDESLKAAIRHVFHALRFKRPE